MIKKEKFPHILAPEQLRGRSVFIIETATEGVKVQTAFLTDDGNILVLPAVFPTQEYALAQLDELRAAVMRHFAEATSVGIMALANASQLKPRPEDTIQ